MDVVILTSPPSFRPQHLEYAVEKGVHCFFENRLAVDAPGVRKVIELAKKRKKRISASCLVSVGGITFQNVRCLDAFWMVPWVMYTQCIAPIMVEKSGKKPGKMDGGFGSPIKKLERPFMALGRLHRGTSSTLH